MKTDTDDPARKTSDRGLLHLRPGSGLAVVLFAIVATECGCQFAMDFPGTDRWILGLETYSANRTGARYHPSAF